MSEVNRQYMLTVLARDGMGWHPHGQSDSYPQFWVDGFGVCGVYRSLCDSVARRWEPDMDWRAAGELLEAMRGKPKQIWVVFAVNLNAALGNASLWLWKITPELIAQAAFEALEAREKPDV